jgi:hypothetical protein
MTNNTVQLINLPKPKYNQNRPLARPASRGVCKLAAATALSFLSLTSARAYEVNVGDLLEVRFHLAPHEVSFNSRSNVLLLGIDQVGSGTATQSVATLFDGATQLGVETAYLDEFGNAAYNGIRSFQYYWAGAGSVFGEPYATTIDESSLLSRDIQGVLLVSFNGSFQFTGVSVGSGLAVYQGGIASESGTGPVIDSIAIGHVSSVPEPATYGLLLLGLASLGLQRRKTV